MGKYVTGMMIGSVVGAAVAMAVNLNDPTLSKKLMRKGKNFSRKCRKKFEMLDMF